MDETGVCVYRCEECEGLFTEGDEMEGRPQAETPAEDGGKEQEETPAAEPVVEHITEIVDLGEIETAAPSAFFRLDDTGRTELSSGTHVEWIDRIDIPDYIKELYDWLVENSDGEGTDLLMDVTNETQIGNGQEYGILLREVTGTGAITESKVQEIMDEIKAEDGAHMRAVYDAFDRDHPEVFWLSGKNKFSLSVSYSSSQYTVRVYFLLKTSDFDIRAAKYKTEEAIRAAINERDSNVQQILSGISQDDDYEKIVYFNQWLTKNNGYNSSSNLNSIDHDCRTCISALAGTPRGTESPVCEGYARAFQVLCDEAGIPCVLVDGNAVSSDGSGGPHMWNNVQLDGKWYAVDVTWNDPIIGGNSDSEGNEEYLLVGAGTVIDGTAFSKSHNVENSASDGGPNFTNGPELAAEKYDTSSRTRLENAKITVGDGSEIVYTAKPQTPKVRVVLSGKTLTAGTDYTVAYADNTDAGTATVTVKAVEGGTYTGEQTASFSIQQAEPIVEWPEYQKVTYTGTAAAIELPRVQLLTGEEYTGQILYSHMGDDDKISVSGMPSAIGSYLIMAEILAQNNNYKSVRCEATLDILASGNEELQFYVGSDAATAENAAVVADQPQYGMLWKDIVAINPALTAKVGGQTGSGAFALRLNGGALPTGKVPDAGEYAVEIVYNGTIGGQKYTDVSVCKVKINIAPVEYTGEKTVEQMVPTNRKQKMTVDLSTLLSGLSNATIDSPKILQGGDFISDVTVAGDGVSFEVAAVETAGKTAEIRVRVTADNYQPFEVSIALTTADKDDAQVAFTGSVPKEKIYGDRTFELRAKAEAAGEGKGVWTWESSNPDILAVTGNGSRATVTVKGAGKAEITASYQSDSAMGSVSAAIAVAKKALTVKPANVSCYVNASAPEFALAYEGLVAGDKVNISKEAAFTLTNKAGAEIAAEEAVKTAGTYTITWSNYEPAETVLEGQDAANYDWKAVTTGTLTVRTKSSGGGGGSGGSATPSTDTTTNSDGSTTTTTTDKATGAVTTTTKYTDGTIVKVVEAADGSSTTERTQPDGTKATTTQDKDGVVKSEVTLSTGAVNAAEKEESPVELPIAQQKPQQESAKAPTVTVSVPGSREVKIEIPVRNAGGGIVAVAVDSNGAETVLKTSIPTADGIVIEASGKVTVKIVDRSKDFSDVPAGRWMADAVDFVSARGLFSGTGENRFSPDSSMTRGMLATVLHNLEGNPAATTEAAFTDLRDGAWYSASIHWAAEKGILSGYGEGRVGAENPITREQLAVILWKYAGSPTASGSELRFSDAATAGNYAKPALQWATENGVMVGSSSGALQPKAQATRAEVAQMLKNFLSIR